MKAARGNSAGRWVKLCTPCAEGDAKKPLVRCKFTAFSVVHPIALKRSGMVYSSDKFGGSHTLYNTSIFLSEYPIKGKG
jgi:hypothetical protein